MLNGFLNLLQALKAEANRTVTENGAATFVTTQSDCLDLFATIGALREAPAADVIARFDRAFAENRDLALRTMFYGRDIRGGLGERRVFRVLLRHLAMVHPESVRRNLAFIAEMGRFDDLMVLMETPCEPDAVALAARQLKEDLESAHRGEPVSLLAKWMPSVNAASPETVRMGKLFARRLGMSEALYRKTLSFLRGRLRLIENSLRESDYTFDYQAQPSRAMFKYRKAFLRNDHERYTGYLTAVSQGRASMHTSSLNPCDLVDQALRFSGSDAERLSLDTTWKALPDFTDGRNALCVVDTSGSMYSGSPTAFAVALSLGMYFAERNRGIFRNHFIVFSTTPRLVEIKGTDLVDRVRYCRGFSEVADTNVQRVFELVLSTAVRSHARQSDLPDTLYIITDMEFNCCTRDASLSNFEYAKRLYEAHGYRLPKVVFWNVQSRNIQQPVTMNEQGVALVSGYSPRIFQMAMRGAVNPYQTMLDTLNSERYIRICA